MGKITKAQAQFLREHTDAYPGDYRRRGCEDGFRPRHMIDRGSPTWDFVARCRDAGLIVVVEHDGAATGTDVRFPYGWKGTKLTDAGRAAL